MAATIYACPRCTRPLQERRDPLAEHGTTLTCPSRRTCGYDGWAVGGQKLRPRKRGKGKRRR